MIIEVIQNHENYIEKSSLFILECVSRY